MPKKSCGSFLFAFVLLASGVPSSSKEDATSPETLITQARKLEELWTDGTPPLVMRAEIQVLNAKGVMTSGQYSVNWVSPIRWREEIRFTDYERLRVHDAKGYWQKSGLKYEPEAVFQLDTLLNLQTVLKLGTKQSLSKVKSHDKNGVQQRCTEVKWAKGTERILCFDEAGGNLLSVEYPKGEKENPPEISRIEYSAFNNVGGKRVPFEIRAFRDRKVVATVRVLEMTATSEENAALFVAPLDSEFWAKCDDLRGPELVDRVQPKYSSNTRSNGEHGRVTCPPISSSHK